MAHKILLVVNCRGKELHFVLVSDDSLDAFAEREQQFSRVQCPC